MLVYMGTCSTCSCAGGGAGGSLQDVRPGGGAGGSLQDVRHKENAENGEERKTSSASNLRRPSLCGKYLCDWGWSPHFNYYIIHPRGSTSTVLVMLYRNEW